MIRTTVTLPDDLAVLVAREARRLDTSVSEVVRRALASFVGLPDGERRQLPFVALGRSGRRHTARDAETILRSAWGDDRRR